VRCNIGNPQAVGQTPLSHVRQTLSLIMNPALLDEPAVQALYPADVIERARAYAEAVPSVGAYSDSQGVKLVREQCAAFISARDGHPASADDIFLTDGASAGVKALMQLLVRDSRDAVLVPIPQYPLYSATTTLLNGTMVPYYLDESASWGVHIEELKRAYRDAKGAGSEARAIVVINPGNPTGQSLPREAVDSVLEFAAEEGLVVLADEVYQENVYGDAPPFTSFRAALSDMAARGGKAAALAAKVQLVSFHSTSKGFIGECGLRGGYYEVQNVPADVRAQLVKLASISLCSNVVGQFATGLMVRPPMCGEASYDTYVAEKSAILSGMHARATRIAKALNELPGVSCNPAEGAMYLFPSLELPAKAAAAAEAKGMAADEFYCIRLLEATGLVVVPGSGFRQVAGTHHFRTTFLPPDDMLDDVLPKLAGFQADFMREFA
jgi:alanine transaminase